MDIGAEDSAAWAETEQIATPERARAAAHRMWSSKFYDRMPLSKVTWSKLIRCGRSYGMGFMLRYKDQLPLVPVPLRRKAAAIVCTNRPKEDNLASVLRELNALPLEQIIVVLYDVPSRMKRHVPQLPRTEVHTYPDVVDPDVGRALGAKLCQADLLLFVDDQHPVDASVLARFLWEVDGRADIALNDLSLRRILFHERGGVQQLQEFLNRCLNRPDLKSNSLNVLPYALSKKALDTIGAATLCVPAKAQAVAILSKLRIVTGGSAIKEIPKANRSAKEVINPLIAGDHAEAWHTAISLRGSRLQLPDRHRNRAILEDKQEQDRYHNGRLSLEGSHIGRRNRNSP